MGDLIPGTILYSVLLYSISEPGVWRADDIAEDLPESELSQIQSAVHDLESRGLIHRNSTDERLWPLRAGREAMQRQSL